MTAIDLRSDTVTQPTDAMRRAMAAAEVGDDVFGEDPSINELQERSAALLGKEAGLLTASGTMSNLIATLAWSNHGDEIIMGDQAHMFWNEGAGQAALAGGADAPGAERRPGDASAAPLTWPPPSARPATCTSPRTSMVCLENTHNRCGGGALTPADTKSVCDTAHAAGGAGASGRRPHFQRRRRAGSAAGGTGAGRWTTSASACPSR